MSPSAPHIAFEDLTSANLKPYLAVYPKVVERVYKATRPKLNQTEILDNDVWRYEELPSTLGPGVALEKEQLARLVKWKM